MLSGLTNLLISGCNKFIDYDLVQREFGSDQLQNNLITVAIPLIFYKVFGPEAKSFCHAPPPWISGTNDFGSCLLIFEMQRLLVRLLRLTVFPFPVYHGNLEVV